MESKSTVVVPDLCARSLVEQKADQDGAASDDELLRVPPGHVVERSLGFHALSLLDPLLSSNRALPRHRAEDAMSVLRIFLLKS